MDTTKRTIFMTGATGFLGSYLLKIFLQHNHKVYCLSRPKKEKSAEERLMENLYFWDPKVAEARQDNLVIFEGDITKRGLDLDHKIKEAMVEEVNEVFHLAAITNLNSPLAHIRKINAQGTDNVLALAKELHHKGKLVKASHISTAFIYGDYSGLFKEDSLELNQKFHTTYEQTKFEAEKIVYDYRKHGLWVDIYRPPIIVGESTTGKAFRFRNIYQLLHICSLNLFDTLPISNPSINLVPVDWVSEAIYLLSEKAGLKNQTYHPFPEEQVAIDDIVTCGCELIGVKKPRMVHLHNFDLSRLSPVQKEILKNNIMSMEFKGKLNSDFTLGVLAAHGFTFPKIDQRVISNLLRYFIGEEVLRGGNGR